MKGETQQDYLNHMNETMGDCGIKRILKDSIVKFPYSLNMGSSMYRDAFNQKRTAKVESFNLEKEGMKRPHSSVRAKSSFMTTAREAFKHPKEQSFDYHGSSEFW